MSDSTRNWLWWVVATVIISCLIIFALQRPVHAADLGVGADGVADLEERIAELEATTARKGNRKVSLTIDGQINAALSYISAGDYTNSQVIQNGNDESFVGFTGAAKVTPDLSAGYRIEINLADLGVLGAPELRSDEPRVRQSYWFLKSERFGSVGVGRQSTSTNDFDKFSVDDAWLAGKPLSLGSLSDLYLTGIDVPFDGGYANVIKYTSPTIAGFSLSATWGDSIDWNSSNGNGNNYDVAVRYIGEFSEFKVTGAAGYRHSTDMSANLVNILDITIPTGDVDTFLVNGSIIHVPTGIFANVSYADQKWNEFDFRLQGLDVTAGLQEHWIPLGKTEVFATYGRFTIDPDGASSRDIDYYGLGATQSLDAAAMDLYIGWRHYQTDDVLETNVDAVNAGARIRF